MKTALGMVAASAFAWVFILRRHEQQVKTLHYIQTGELFGCDATWAHPSETGQSWIFSVPWVKSLKTGRIHQYPLMG